MTISTKFHCCICSPIECEHGTDISMYCEHHRNNKKKEIENIKHPIIYGWVCPICGRANAPMNMTCECASGKYTITSGTTGTAK